MIYFIREGFEGNVKIGYTKDNICKRKSALQNGNSKRLIIMGTMNGNQDFETYLKGKFRHCQLVGEWFSPKKELLEYIDRNVRFHHDYVFFLRELVTKTREKAKTPMGMNDSEKVKVGKWNVVKSGDYYRAFRKMQGKTVGVHLGREFNEDDAREKITAKGYSVED